STTSVVMDWHGWLLAALPGALRVLLLDRVDELVLGHLRAPLDVQLAGGVEEILLRRVGVHSSGGLAALPRLRRRALRLLVRRALVLLGLPVVAHLMELVLEGGERGAVCAFALAVGLHRGVVRLAPRPLRLLGRALDRRRHLFTRWHGSTPVSGRLASGYPDFLHLCPSVVNGGATGGEPHGFGSPE